MARQACALRSLSCLFVCIFGAASANPRFAMPSQAQYRAQYESASVIYKTDYEMQHLDYTTFIDMLVDAWLHQHASDREDGNATWENPVANDWVGCLLYEFPKSDAFTRVNFRSYTLARDLPQWISDHRDAAASVEGGSDLIARLDALTEWSSLCEDLVRGDDGMRL